MRRVWFAGWRTGWALRLTGADYKADLALRRETWEVPLGEQTLHPTYRINRMTEEEPLYETGEMDMCIGWRDVVAWL